MEGVKFAITSPGHTLKDESFGAIETKFLINEKFEILNEGHIDFKPQIPTIKIFTFLTEE